MTRSLSTSCCGGWWRTAFKQRRRRTAGRVFAARRHSRRFFARLVRTRSASNCSATRSNRSAGSRSPPSGAWRRVDAIDVTVLNAERRRSRAFRRISAARIVVSAGRAGRSGRRRPTLSGAARPPAGISQRQRDDAADHVSFPSVTAAGVPAGSLETTSHLPIESVERFSGDIGKVRDELDTTGGGQQVVDRLPDRRPRSSGCAKSLAQTKLAEAEAGCILPHGHLKSGFRLVPAQSGAGQRQRVVPSRRRATARCAAKSGASSTASWSCAKATTSSIFRTASAAIAG